LIDHARDFGADMVSGYTGRLTDLPIEESIPKYKQIFGKFRNVRSTRAFASPLRIAIWGEPGGKATGILPHNPVAWEMLFDALPADNIELEWEPCHQMVSLIDPIPQLRKWVDKSVSCPRQGCDHRMGHRQGIWVHGP
jgi:sugar phosphate isomerase/epimerase